VPTRQLDPGDLGVSGNEETRQPAPVEVPLDENSSTMPHPKPGVTPSAARRGVTIRSSIAILAVGVLGGAGLSQGLAQPDRSTRSPSTTGTAAVARPFYKERTDIPPANGDTVTKLLDGLDAVTETEITRVAATDGPQQVAAIQFLRQQHEDVRALIITHYFGWHPMS